MDWTSGTQHTITASGSQNGPGAKYEFASWSDGGVASHHLIVPASAETLLATYNSFYQLTATASPTTGGSVSGSGFYAAGTSVSVSATPAAGFHFDQFTAGLSGSVNPQQITVKAPTTVTANFIGGATQVYAQTGPRNDTGLAGERQVTFYISNAGPGIAANARITGVTIVRAIGQGTVTVSPSTTFPVAAGTITPNSSNAAPVDFLWPESETRVTMVVAFSANDGKTTGSTTLSFYR
jgi:hypothetical protein